MKKLILATLISMVYMSNLAVAQVKTSDAKISYNKESLNLNVRVIKVLDNKKVFDETKNMSIENKSAKNSKEEIVKLGKDESVQMFSRTGKKEGVLVRLLTKDIKEFHAENGKVLNVPNKEEIILTYNTSGLEGCESDQLYDNEDLKYTILVEVCKNAESKLTEEEILEMGNLEHD